jgi:hypothetical protein
MRKLILPAAALLAVGLFSGCEWESGGGVESWDDSATSDASGNYVDFSGVYRSADGGVLVREAGATFTTTNTIVATNSVTDEYLGIGDGSKTAFEGALAHSPVRGTLTIIVGAYRCVDTAGMGNSNDTVSLTITPADGSAGTINYSTRTWTLSFPAPIEAGTRILASYTYLATSQEVISSQGNTGKPIYQFVAYQMGNKLQMIDNVGSVYEGMLGAVLFSGSAGGGGGDGATAQQVTEASGQFYATGVSQGYEVEILGTMKKSTVLQPYWNGQYDKDGRQIYDYKTVGGYTLDGSFIEKGGKTGVIKATSPAF